MIDYESVFDAFVSSKEEARRAIVEYGINQRSKYSNPSVREIELSMEKEFDILAVNLGEIDVETAKEIQAAFTYMYQKYPILKGSLTNLSLGNFKNSSNGKLALTDSRIFIINGEYGAYPQVVKDEIILGANKFLKRNNLLKTCEDMSETGYWPKNSNITSIVVHELGHQLLAVYTKERYGLYEGYYITEKSKEAYNSYLTDSLSSNQTIAKEVMNMAYNNWKANHPGCDYETFCQSISKYAVGEQDDGGISYTETFAEAIADVYLNGENASEASREIEKLASQFR